MILEDCAFTSFLCLVIALMAVAEFNTDDVKAFFMQKSLQL